jgi:hypothetical protein
VGGGDVTVRTLVHLESRQGLEDLATSVVQEQDAKVIVQVSVPQCVHIIEETKIAYNDKV